MTDDELIIACKLNPDLVRERIDEWSALVAQATAVEAHDTGVLLRFGDAGGRGGGVDAARVGALIAAEHECCPFFSFTLTVDDRELALEVTAPPDARVLVDALLGDSATAAR